MTAEVVPSPYGLGWTRRLALVAAPEASIQELFDRQLFLGLGFATIAFLSSGLVFIPLAATDLEQGLVWLLYSLVPVLLAASVVGLFVVRGRSVAPYAHAINTLLLPIGMFSGLASSDGLAVWTQTAWGLTYPLVLGMLDGVRGAVVWTGLSILGWAAIAAYDTHTGASTRHAAVPLMDAPWVQAANFSMVAMFNTLLLTWFIQQRRIVERLLDDERQRADALLRNVLPAAVVPRVKARQAVADREDEVTVVFADLVGFTTLASQIPAGRVVEMLGELFGDIDRIAREEGVEKVKTIGDCYMAVAGAPERCRDHADRAVRFAVRVRDAVAGRTYYGSPIAVRIGVHSGPVVAGILGEQRMLWDLWGDTVNTASRMESSGVPGEVQVSDTTRRLCAATWTLEDRGEVPLKGRAPMRAFLVKRETT